MEVLNSTEVANNLAQDNSKGKLYETTRKVIIADRGDCVVYREFEKKVELLMRKIFQRVEGKEKWIFERSW